MPFIGNIQPIRIVAANDLELATDIRAYFERLEQLFCVNPVEDDIKISSAFTLNREEGYSVLKDLTSIKLSM